LFLDDQKSFLVIQEPVWGPQKGVAVARDPTMGRSDAACGTVGDNLRRLCGIGVKSAAGRADPGGMSTIPERHADVIPWCQTHVKVWEVDPAAIGLDEATVDELDDLTGEAEAALREYQRAKLKVAAALARFHDRAGRLRGKASNAVGRVRAFAPTQPSPSKVLTDARIPSRRDASPLPAPGVPFRFESRLLEDGALKVSFECDNRAEGGRRLRGVTYVVERRDGEDGPFVYVETALERRFLDETIPLGTTTVTYRVTAQTSTRRGHPALKTVNFGGGGVGGGVAGRGAA
jgi:hypothetical protein